MDLSCLFIFSVALFINNDFETTAYCMPLATRFQSVIWNMIDIEWWPLSPLICAVSFRLLFFLFSLCIVLKPINRIVYQYTYESPLHRWFMIQNHLKFTASTERHMNEWNILPLDLIGCSKNEKTILLKSINLSSASFSHFRGECHNENVIAITRDSLFQQQICILFISTVFLQIC